MTTFFPPSRAAGLSRFHEFLPNTGSKYTATRNFDFGPENRTNVSLLSPYIRHRLILEEEVMRGVLSRFTPSSASKFVEEVCWRTYWKGWLEMRPEVWHRYRQRVADLESCLEHDDELQACYARATRGQTGITAFDAWVRELIDFGYMHNHARMWFASIWIFTLKLPWELGAEFFFRHLYDGDPASNTLSWRWVAGLHTKGKTYLARPDNIMKYTESRFPSPEGQLALQADCLTEDDMISRRALPTLDHPTTAQNAVLLVTDEDCFPETLPFGVLAIKGAVGLDVDTVYPYHASSIVKFKKEAIHDACQRAVQNFSCRNFGIVKGNAAEVLSQICNQSGADIVVTAYAPVGPTADALKVAQLGLEKTGLPVLQVQRGWDRVFWPYATGGYFKLKEKIPVALKKVFTSPNVAKEQ